MVGHCRPSVVHQERGYLRGLQFSVLEDERATPAQQTQSRRRDPANDIQAIIPPVQRDLRVE